MIRRNFLAHLTATAAGLLVADDALALLVEPRRKVWPGWTAPAVPQWPGVGECTWIRASPSGRVAQWSTDGETWFEDLPPWLQASDPPPTVAPFLTHPHP